MLWNMEMKALLKESNLLLILGLNATTLETSQPVLDGLGFPGVC